MSEEFVKTAELVKALVLDSETQLKLYGLYKQATQGDVTIPAPSDPIGLAKYKSWLSNSGKSQNEAEDEYIELVSSFNSTWGIGVSRPQVEDIEEEPLNPEESAIKNLCDITKTGTIDRDLIQSIGINSQDRQGLTPLHHAVDEGLIETVKILVDLGASANIQDTEGMTPLHYAVELNYSEILQVLLKAPGVDPSIQDSDGNSIHDLANQKSEKIF
jgi:diazepam-binding inhibitor (GABA receptor modulator, acyl-CoA-binding protein)